MASRTLRFSLAALTAFTLFTASACSKGDDEENSSGTTVAQTQDDDASGSGGSDSGDEGEDDSTDDSTDDSGDDGDDSGDDSVDDSNGDDGDDGDDAEPDDPFDPGTDFDMGNMSVCMDAMLGWSAVIGVPTAVMVPGYGQEDVDELYSVLDDLASNVPPELADEFSLVREELEAAVDEIGPLSDDLEDLDGWAALAEVYSGPEFSAAVDGINAWFDENCG